MKTDAPLPDASTTRPEPSRAVTAWTTFAWIYLALGGVLNVIYGIAALRNKSYFREDSLLWSNLDTWGWVAIVIGGLAILFAVLIYRRTMAGAIGGMAIAIFAFIANFLSIGAYPVWSVIAMVINGFVIWALPRSVESTR